MKKNLQSGRPANLGQVQPAGSGKSANTTSPTISSSSSSDISTFLDVARRVKPDNIAAGGLIFALDATLSREQTWDVALNVQVQMFKAVAAIGTLKVQLVYFRGFGECRASKWVKDTKSLSDLMTGIGCRGGKTQIGNILRHARREVAERKRAKVSAMVFVGDAMEENPDHLCQLAGEMGVLGVPVFMFQEGRDGLTERTFRQISDLSGGAYMRFGEGSADQLAQLLKAVAQYAAGGRAALAADRSRTAQTLLEQLK